MKNYNQYIKSNNDNLRYIIPFNKINEDNFSDNIDVIRKKGLELNTEYNNKLHKFNIIKYEFDKFKNNISSDIQDLRLDKDDREKLVDMITLFLDTLYENQAHDEVNTIHLDELITLCVYDRKKVNKYIHVSHFYKDIRGLWWVGLGDNIYIPNLSSYTLINLYDELLTIDKLHILLNADIFRKFNESVNEMEFWKPIPIEEYSSYSASSLGRIKNSKGVIIRPHIKKRSKNIIIVGLTIGNRKKNFILSQLIAKTFLKGSGSVIHRDGDKTNNRVENLKYTNNPSKYASIFSDKPSGYDAHDSFIIHQYDLDGNLVKTYGSIGDASKATGVPTTNISKVAKGLRNKAGGFIWEYDDDKTDYKGTDPQIIKDIRDYYSLNDVSISEVWRKFKITTDIYGVSRIIRGLVYKTELYLSDRAKSLIYNIDAKDNNEIKKIMQKKFRYYITDDMLDNI